MLLTGTFRRSVDDKQRIAIPKKLRLALTQSAQPSADATSESSLVSAELSFYIAPGTDGSLAIYSEQSFSRLADKLSAGSPAGQHTRAFSRLFYAQAQRVDMDSQGRIRIDPELVALASLDREVVMVGVGDRIELWDVDRWEAYRREQQSRYDELAELAFESKG